MLRLAKISDTTQIEDDDPYGEDALDVAMSQLSVDDLARSKSCPSQTKY